MIKDSVGGDDISFGGDDGFDDSVGGDDDFDDCCFFKVAMILRIADGDDE